MKFVPKEVALELFTIGFDEACWAWFNVEDDDIRLCYYEEESPLTPSVETHEATYYNKPLENICLPTYDQVIDWFRFKYDYLFVLCNDYYKHNNDPEVIDYYFILRKPAMICSEGVQCIKSSDYLEALNGAILSAINLVNN